MGGLRAKSLVLLRWLSLQPTSSLTGWQDGCRTFLVSYTVACVVSRRALLSCRAAACGVQGALQAWCGALCCALLCDLLSWARKAGRCLCGFCVREPVCLPFDVCVSFAALESISPWVGEDNARNGCQGRGGWPRCQFATCCGCGGILSTEVAKGGLGRERCVLLLQCL
jgi:hypothetical protein